MKLNGKAEYNIANGGDGGQTYTKDTMSKETFKKLSDSTK
jgi:hypothetical protein